MVTKEKSKSQEVAIVQHRETSLRITWQDVKTLICPLATDQETAIFLKTCQALQLSPFHNEIYLIKYNERDKAATVIAIDSYLKAAEANPQFDGFESGIILKDSTGELKFREGAFLLDEERSKLVGGWARVYRKDRSRPFYVAVNKKECIRYTRDGHLTQFWTEEKQPSMLRKVALKRALVEAFPSLFTGAISNVEADYEMLSEEVKKATPKPRGETPEGELPPVLEKGGQPDWKKFYARIKSELGLTPEQAHELVGVESFKDALASGWTMERIWDAMVTALQQQKPGVEHGEEEAGDAASAEAHEDEEPVGTAAPAKLKRDPASIKTINDLLKACHEDWNLQPKAVYVELNVKSANEITELPSECYRRIAAVRG